MHKGLKRTVDYKVEFDSGFLSIASLLLTLLLAMELVDKINYRDELELARDLQGSLIPKELPSPPGFQLGAHNEIANTVGGDIYDFVPLADGRLAVLFGDASGHGMAAGLVMAVAHAAFRTQLDVDPSPPAVFATLNRILCRTGSSRAFFGCVYFLLSAGRILRRVRGGTPAGVARRNRRNRARANRQGRLPARHPAGMTWTVETGRLEPGESLFLHSDGLSEARDDSGAEFGDERVEAALKRWASLDPERLTGSIALALHDFRHRQAPEDDVSIAVIRRPIAPA
jgi:serine phosphatase RsbU (regulator of sigma subunit)